MITITIILDHTDPQGRHFNISQKTTEIDIATQTAFTINGWMAMTYKRLLGELNARVVKMREIDAKAKK